MEACRMSLRRNSARVELSQNPHSLPLLPKEGAQCPPADSFLQQQAAFWAAHGQDAGLLLRGQALAAAERWAAGHARELDDAEREFLQECAQATRCAERQARQARQNHLLLVGVAVLMLAAFCLFNQARYKGEEYRQAGNLAAAAHAQAEQTRAQTESRVLASYAQGLIERDPRLAILLAIEAARKAACSGPITAEASAALSQALASARWQIVLQERPAGGLKEVAWSSQGDRLLTLDSENRVAVWDAVTGERLPADNDTDFPRPASVDAIRSLDESGPAEPFIASDTDSGSYQTLWNGDRTRALDLSWNGAATLREERGGGRSFPLRGHAAPISAATWSGDGSRLATADLDGKVMVWNALTGARLATLSGHTFGVAHIAWSTDDRLIATASWDHTVILWDAASSARLQTLRGHTDQVLHVAWSPDGSRLASASRDGTAIIWDLEPEAELPALGTVEELTSFACRRAARNMTQAEWAQYMSPGEPYRKTCPEWP